MSLTLELPSDLEKDLNEKAAAKGLSVAQFAVAALRRGLNEDNGNRKEKGEPDKGILRLLELRGLGAEIWKDTGDAQEWVNKERDDWERTY